MGSTPRALRYAIQRGNSNVVVPGRLKMKSSPMILAGVQHPEANPFAINRSTIRITHTRCPYARARGWAARCCSTCSIGLAGAAAAGRTIRW
jgi:hypothetical protein